MRDVAYYIDRILVSHQPKAIFIYVGNDIVAGEKDKTPDQVLELYKYVVKRIRLKHPEIPITWLAISPSEKRWAAWDKIQLTNQLVSDFCLTEKKLYTINAGNKFIGEDGWPLKQYYKDDKLHYNEEGYHVWGRAIANEVKTIVSGK